MPYNTYLRGSATSRDHNLHFPIPSGLPSFMGMVFANQATMARDDDDPLVSGARL